MFDKKDWNSFFFIDEEPDLDVWSAKCECAEDAEVRQIMSINMDTRPRDALEYAIGVGDRVPTPIFLDGRYTPVYGYMLPTPTTGTLLGSKKETDQTHSDQEDDVVSKKKPSKLNRFLRGIRRLVNGRRRKGEWNSL